MDLKQDYSGGAYIVENNTTASNTSNIFYLECGITKCSANFNGKCKQPYLRNCRKNVNRAFDALHKIVQIQLLYKNGEQSLQGIFDIISK